MRIIYILSLCIPILFSCKKSDITKPEPLPELNMPVDTNGFLEIHINNLLNNNTLTLGATTYTNANSDTFNVSLFRYFVSNIELHTLNGDVFKEVESYYLIDQSKPNSL